MILVSKNWLIILFVFVLFKVYITHYVSENEKSFSVNSPQSYCFFLKSAIFLQKKWFSVQSLVFRDVFSLQFKGRRKIGSLLEEKAYFYLFKVYSLVFKVRCQRQSRVFKTINFQLLTFNSHYLTIAPCALYLVSPFMITN